MIYTLNYDAPPVNKNEILRYAGAGRDAKDVCAVVEECLTETKFTYKVCMTQLPVIWGEYVDLGFMKTDSKTVKKCLEGCESVIVFAATVGMETDRLIAKYSVTSPARALIFQAIGAERIESLCDTFCADMGKDKIITPRFSPGYGDFPIETQRDIFSMLDCPRKIGLTLNESLIMSPSKSVTAIIGVKNADT